MNYNKDFFYVEVCELCPLWDFERGCISSFFASQSGFSFSYSECYRYPLLLDSLNKEQETQRIFAEQEYLNSLKPGELPF